MRRVAFAGRPRLWWILVLAVALFAAIAATMVATYERQPTVELIAETPEGVKVYRIYHHASGSFHWVAVEKDGSAFGVNR